MEKQAEQSNLTGPDMQGSSICYLAHKDPGLLGQALCWLFCSVSPLEKWEGDKRLHITREETKPQRPEMGT